MNLDKNLKRFLTHAQWTGNVLSRKAGVPASTLHQWMTGGSVRELRHLKRLCEVIGRELGRKITIDEITFEELVLDASAPDASVSEPSALALFTELRDGWLEGRFEVEVKLKKMESKNTRRSK
jgi:transcriptional regulator with XRE-family HTH domain